MHRVDSATARPASSGCGSAVPSACRTRASADVLRPARHSAVVRGAVECLGRSFQRRVDVSESGSERVEGRAAPARIAVIGMGRLGGGELRLQVPTPTCSSSADPNPGEDETKAVRWPQTIPRGGPLEILERPATTRDRRHRLRRKARRTGPRSPPTPRTTSSGPRRGRCRRFAHTRSRATRISESSSCTWRIASATPKVASPLTLSKRSVESRLVSMPSGCHAEQIRRSTAKLPAGDWPTSSGPSNCCSRSTDTATSRCTTRRRCSRSTQQVGGTARRRRRRASRTRGSPRPRHATAWSWCAANPTPGPGKQLRRIAFAAGWPEGSGGRVPRPLPPGHPPRESHCAQGSSALMRACRFDESWWGLMRVGGA